MYIYIYIYISIKKHTKFIKTANISLLFRSIDRSISWHIEIFPGLINFVCFFFHICLKSHIWSWHFLYLYIYRCLTCLSCTQSLQLMKSISLWLLQFNLPLYMFCHIQQKWIHSCLINRFGIYNILRIYIYTY